MADVCVSRGPRPAGELEYDDRPDPIVEVAAPDDYVPENLGRQIAYDVDDEGRG
jgi:hypothetical protein